MAPAKKAPAKKATANASKEVAAKKDQMPAMPGIDFGADSGAGMEGTDKDSFAIPFLRIIQKMSPQVDEQEAEYMPEAKPGMFMNSVSTELYDGNEGMDFYPCAYQRRFLRWGPRTAEGGFKGEYMPEDVDKMIASGEVVEVERRLWFPNAEGKVNEKTCDKLVDTRSHFGILVDANGNMQNVLLALSSTQIKKSKQLMSILANAKVDTKNGKVTPPTWANKIHITTVGESNDQGSWHGLRVAANGFVTDPAIYQAGKDFHQSIAAGEAKVNYAEAESGTETKEQF